MANLELYEIKNLKKNLDSQILNLVKSFEDKSGLEVIGIYIERIDTSEMSSSRSSIISCVEVQAVLEPVIETKPNGGGSE